MMIPGEGNITNDIYYLENLQKIMLMMMICCHYHCLQQQQIMTPIIMIMVMVMMVTMMMVMIVIVMMMMLTVIVMKIVMMNPRTPEPKILRPSEPENLRISPKPENPTMATGSRISGPYDITVL